MTIPIRDWNDPPIDLRNHPLELSRLVWLGERIVAAARAQR